MTHRARVLGIAGAVVALVVASAMAQAQAPEQTPGGWRAIETEFTNYPRLTREERREVLEQFTAVVSVLRDVATLNPPIGLELTPSISNIDLYSRFVIVNSQPLPAMMWIRMNKYTLPCPTCRVAADSLWDGAFNVIANAADPLYGNWRNPAWKLEEDWYYLEPKMLSEAGGVRHYEYGYAVVTARTEPLFVPVTQQRFLRARLAEMQQHLARVEALKQQGTPYEQHARGREERARTWQKVMEGARSYQPPAKIAEMQAQHDKNERELDARLRRSEAADRARLEQGVATVRVPGAGAGERAGRHQRPRPGSPGAMVPQPTSVRALCQAGRTRRPPARRGQPSLLRCIAAADEVPAASAAAPERHHRQQRRDAGPDRHVENARLGASTHDRAVAATSFERTLYVPAGTQVLDLQGIVRYRHIGQGAYDGSYVQVFLKADR